MLEEASAIVNSASRSAHTTSENNGGQNPSTGQRPVNLRKARKRIALLRDRLYRQRLILKEKRNELRQEVDELAALDTKFMGLIRQFLENGIPPDPNQARTLYSELESKRDELGNLQYDYDTAEADHDAAEADFEEEEERLQTLIFDQQSRRASTPTESSRSSSEAYIGPLKSSSIGRLNQKSIEKHDSEYPASENGIALKANPVQTLGWRPDSPYHLAIEQWVQDAVSHNISNALGQESFGLPQKRDQPAGNANARSSQQLTSTQSLNFSPHFKVEATHRSTINWQTSGGIAPVLLHQKFDDSHPRITWWILHTFGNLPVDYVRRAQEESLLSVKDNKSVDNGQWARLVYDYWRNIQASDNLLEASWDEISYQAYPESRQSRLVNLDNSYVWISLDLVLSLESSAVRYTLENYKNWFPSDIKDQPQPSQYFSSIPHHMTQDTSYKRRSL
ncbi:MAG: hypothetical protein HETSPECPRED_003055 [Heterodermia speciosa]|uniref:Uncharacterized protein n=1 Tax=Heterodermia speciosa TaxID=116794 RepID=A0A8H3J5X8_9LECA|nr:MAG: hypothetical protein HETSPECPRED_003055 [Heterodermia speciosa]